MCQQLESLEPLPATEVKLLDGLTLHVCVYTLPLAELHLEGPSHWWCLHSCKSSVPIFVAAAVHMYVMHISIYKNTHMYVCMGPQKELFVYAHNIHFQERREELEHAFK